MAMFLFTRAILAGEPIRVFNNGDMLRDFTYIDDISQAVCRLLGRIPVPDPGWCGTAPDPGSSTAPFRVYNIGNNRPEALMELISILEKQLGRRAQICFEPMQPGDVPATFADIDDLARDIDFIPSTPLEQGVRQFVSWYFDYFGIAPPRTATAAGDAKCTSLPIA